MNILIVDDQPGVRMSMAKVLEAEGYEVTDASDGFEAFEEVKKTHFDVVFLDLKMPGWNGVQTLKEIKKVDPNIIVIIMTAYATDDLVEEAKKEGVYEVLYKPLEIVEVIKILKRINEGNQKN